MQTATHLVFRASEFILFVRYSVHVKPNNELQCNFRTKNIICQIHECKQFCMFCMNNGRRLSFHGSLLDITLLYSVNSISIPNSKHKWSIDIQDFNSSFSFMVLLKIGNTWNLYVSWVGHWRRIVFVLVLQRTIDSLQWITTQVRPLKWDFSERST